MRTRDSNMPADLWSIFRGDSHDRGAMDMESSFQEPAASNPETEDGGEATDTVENLEEDDTAKTSTDAGTTAEPSDAAVAIQPEPASVEANASNELSGAPELKEGAEFSLITIYSGSSISLDLSEYFMGDASSFVYSAVSDTEHVSTTVSGSILDIVPMEFWSGESVITITVSNSEGSNDFELHVNVMALNLPPRLIKPIGTVEFNQGSSHTIDMWEYFWDMEGTLSFMVSDAEGLIFDIDADGLLTISADWCWYGSGDVVVTATDGESSVQSNMFVKVNAIWMPFRYPEIKMNPREVAREIGLSSIVDVEVADVRAVSSHPMLSAEIVDGVLVITPREGWSGEASVEVSILSADGQVGNIVIPVTVSERFRPVTAWVFNYIFASMIAGLFIFFKMYRQSRAAKNPSPVRLSSYRHYKR